MTYNVQKTYIDMGGCETTGVKLTFGFGYSVQHLQTVHKSQM